MIQTSPAAAEGAEGTGSKVNKGGFMKIAIPVEDKNMEAGICPSFGRTPFFLIYDTSSGEAVYMDNSAASNQGGAGIKAAQFVADQKAEALLTPRCGENAAAVLKASNIKIYRTISNSIRENIKAFNDKALAPLEEIHPGFHNHGGR
jgi:predicted Fe-Mo cluster-binding NifX family protein